jgi:hypothetical protein
MLGTDVPRRRICGVAGTWAGYRGGARERRKRSRLNTATTGTIYVYNIFAARAPIGAVGVDRVSTAAAVDRVTATASDLDGVVATASANRVRSRGAFEAIGSVGARKALGQGYPAEHR